MKREIVDLEVLNVLCGPNRVRSTLRASLLDFLLLSVLDRRATCHCGVPYVGDERGRKVRDTHLAIGARSLYQTVSSTAPCERPKNTRTGEVLYVLHCGRVGKGKREKVATATDLNMPNNLCLVWWAHPIIALLDVQLRQQQRQITRWRVSSCDRVREKAAASSGIGDRDGGLPAAPASK